MCEGRICSVLNARVSSAMFASNGGMDGCIGFMKVAYSGIHSLSRHFGMLKWYPTVDRMHGKGPIFASSKLPTTLNDGGELNIIRSLLAFGWSARNMKNSVLSHFFLLRFYPVEILPCTLLSGFRFWSGPAAASLC